MRVTGLDLPVTLFLGIPLDVWSAFWIGTLHNTDYYKAAFLTLYHLEIATIGGDGGDVEVVRPVEGFSSLWVGYSLFMLTPPAACLGGCPLSRLPWQT